MAQYSTRAQRQRTGHFSDEVRAQVYAETAGLCFYCGWPADCIDHIIPYSYGGSDAPYNLVAACSVCNTLASDLIFDDLEAKRRYLHERLQLKGDKRRFVVSFCADCREPFRPSWHGSTAFLCASCNAHDLAGAPDPVEYRQRTIRNINRTLREQSVDNTPSEVLHYATRR